MPKMTEQKLREKLGVADSIKKFRKMFEEDTEGFSYKLKRYYAKLLLEMFLDHLKELGTEDSD
jgi:hypothetical protein